MFADVLSNKTFNRIVILLEVENLICLLFITQLYFDVPKNIRQNSTHYFITKIPNEEELQQIAFNHLSDIDFQDFMNLYKNVLQSYILFSDWYYSCIG